MRVIETKLDDSFYPISRRKLWLVFGFVVWSKSYVMDFIGGGLVAWSDKKGNYLKEG